MRRKRVPKAIKNKLRTYEYDIDIGQSIGATALYGLRP